MSGPGRWANRRPDSLQFFDAKAGIVLLKKFKQRSMGKERQRALCLLLACVFIVGALFAEAQERPREEVTVTAVEVPVRVLLKGEAVRDLTREDFEIFENGIKQEITQFEVISRKIARPSAEMPVPVAEQVRPPKRLF